MGLLGVSPNWEEREEGGGIRNRKQEWGVRAGEDRGSERRGRRLHVMDTGSLHSIINSSASSRDGGTQVKTKIPVNPRMLLIALFEEVFQRHFLLQCMPPS